MRPHAFDANAIHAFQEERVAGFEGPGHQAIRKIFASDCIALDEDELCVQEWLDCAAGTFPYALRTWIDDELLTGRIRIFPVRNIKIHKDLIQNSLPKKDHKWVKLAIGSGGRIIVSNDVDFFDPSKKHSSANIKQKLRQNGGKLSRHLKKKYDVDVVCMHRFCEI